MNTYHHNRKREQQRGLLRAARMALAMFAFLGALLLPFLEGQAQSTSEDVVYVVDISGEIDLGLAPYLERVLNDAAEADAAAVLIEIDTPGGRLDAVLQMQDALLSSEVPTVAFVDRNAFSAGALVAIASETIYMAPGSAMGAATPIDGATGETASEKVISAVTATFESTAEARGRDPQIAAAMVDPDIEIPGVVDSGQLLTLTDTQATSVGYADGIYSTREEVLGALGLADARVIDTSPSFLESLVRVLTNPIVSSLLVLGGIFLIIGDLFVDGVGLGTLFGLILLGTFFYGHMLAGLAGVEDLLLIGAGLLLIAAEVFVIPGFGIAGIAGLVTILVGTYLALTNRDVRTPQANDDALLSMAIIGLGALIGFVAMIWLIPRTASFSRMVLSADVGDAGEKPLDKPKRRWSPKLSNSSVESVLDPVDHAEPTFAVNERGVAESDLRPSGIALFGGHRVDVVTTGDYVTAGTEIEIVADEGYRRLVQAVRS